VKDPQLDISNDPSKLLPIVNRDRLRCDTCGRRIRRSSFSSHKKTRVHQSALRKRICRERDLHYVSAYWKTTIKTAHYLGVPVYGANSARYIPGWFLALWHRRGFENEDINGALDRCVTLEGFGEYSLHPCEEYKRQLEEHKEFKSLAKKVRRAIKDERYRDSLTATYALIDAREKVALM